MRAQIGQRRKRAIALGTLASLVFLAGLAGWQCSSRTSTSPMAGSEVQVFSADDSQGIYSSDANDSWNRIFHLLFTRTVKTRRSDEFSDSQPFTNIQAMGFPSLRVSTRSFERVEIGDRAIEPLYPSFFSNAGVIQVLDEPRFSQLKQALTEACAETNPRPAIARALMQCDAWAAYDLLYLHSSFYGFEGKGYEQRRNELLLLLARLVNKLALKPEEIASLPRNYDEARAKHDLPDLFSLNSSWIEIQLSPHRLHEVSTDFRRAARVFIKPSAATTDKNALLERLRKDRDPVADIDAATLIMQDVLINHEGTVVPSNLTTDVQIRRFVKDTAGKLLKTEVREIELSRREFLTNPSQGGLIEYTEKAPAYLTSAGNDYTFASRMFDDRASNGSGSPVLVTLGTRCQSCHGKLRNVVLSFSTHEGPPLPPITLMNPSSNDHAWYVAGRKEERDDFKKLREQWYR